MMKKISFLLFVLLFVFSGCEQFSQFLGIQPEEDRGLISFYAGGTDNTETSAFSCSHFENFYDAVESYIYIRKLEISITGEKWIEIFSGPVEIKVKDNYKMLLTEPKEILASTYNGVKLFIEPKVKFKYIDNNGSMVTVDKILEKGPREIYIKKVDDSFSDFISVEPSDTFSFTSSNGFLAPFSIRKDKETSLIFTFKIISIEENSEITDWILYVGLYTVQSGN